MSRFQAKTNVQGLCKIFVNDSALKMARRINDCQILMPKFVPSLVSLVALPLGSTRHSTYMILLSFPRASLRAKHFLTTVLPRIFCNLLWTFFNRQRNLLSSRREIISKLTSFKTCQCVCSASILVRKTFNAITMHYCTEYNTHYKSLYCNSDT